VLEVEERFMIKDLFRRGLTISEIARQTGHDRKTIRVILNEPLVAAAKPRQKKACKIDPYIPYLEKRLKEGVLNAQKLYQEIVAQGYEGKDRQVRQFVQPFREARQRQATMRYETEPGQQAQVDWGSFGFIQHQGRQRRLYAFVMTLGWSRAMYLEFTVSADTAWWLRCHLHGFHYLGGIPREVLHDNLKTAVLSRAADGVSHWHPRYLDFAHYYGFTPRACQPYQAQTKGKVESGVRYVRGNFWPGLAFRDLADLNRQGRQWLDTIANVRVHGTTRQIPWRQLSQEKLQSLAGKADYDTSLITYRRSSKDCLVSYEGNYYSLPAAYAQQRLMLKETEQRLLLIFTLDGQELARHHLVEGHQQRVVQKNHYQGLAKATPKPKRLGAVQIGDQASLPLALDAPQVEIRPLHHYEQWLEVAA
jgi:transposase